MSAGSTSKNIDKAAEKLDFINMSEQEKKRYERFLINLHREEDILETAKEEGEAIGLKKAKKQIDKAQQETKQAQDQAIIAMIKNTNLSDEAIANELGVGVN